jgi:hypothetical protein
MYENYANFVVIIVQTNEKRETEAAVYGLLSRMSRDSEALAG